jgi:NitT/TauT family transport system ATP-binding protein
MNFELLRIWETTQTTVVFVTHDLREAAFLSDAVVVMTRRPGEIRRIVDSPLSRPRERDAIYCDEFHEMTRTLNDLIG